MAENHLRGRFFIILLLLFSNMICLIPDSFAASFKTGSRRFSFVAGSGYTYDNSYTVVGLGVGYFVFDGLELGLDAEAWLGGDPGIYKVSPQVKYILPVQSKLRPYVGTFYRHLFIDDFDDQDSTGARGGVYFTSFEDWFIGVGAVYEKYLDCDDDKYTSCDDIYPEITISILF